MYLDINVDNNLVLENELFKDIDVYKEYIETGYMKFETIIPLFYICNYLEDVDLEHVAYFMSTINNYNNNAYHYNSLLYMVILYEICLRKQYYILLNNYIIYNNISPENFNDNEYIDLPFYENMVKYLNHKKEEYDLDNM